MAVDPFDYLSSVEAEAPTGLHGWAKRLVEELNRWKRLRGLATMDLNGKAGYTVKVNAAEDGFELVP